MTTAIYYPKCQDGTCISVDVLLVVAQVKLMMHVDVGMMEWNGGVDYWSDWTTGVPRPQYRTCLCQS